ncbi:MAG TPA: hypothetical protein VJU86_10645 [Pyrinomonadaceae bacterium]|nr:hypothetical protein [Pyrinomonadaceae bacterium]
MLARLTTLTFILAIALTAGAPVNAQGPGEGHPGTSGPGGLLPGGRPGPRGRPPRRQQPGPPGPQADFLSSEMRFGDRVVKGSPYSAHFSTENTQTLADGTRVTRKSNGVVYRNTEGRTRREQTLGALGHIPVEGQPKQLIFINDPIARAHYVLDVKERSARKLPFRDGPPPPTGPPPDSKRPPDPMVTESLGTKQIEGVEAEGTRTTITIPVGRIGNDRPLKIVSERWFSPELKIVILSKHNDPFSGDNVYQLTGINREEPPLTLFTVPADYRVTEERPPVSQRNPRQ